MLKFNYLKGFIFLIVFFFVLQTFAQETKTNKDVFKEILSLEVQNDTLSDFIVTLKKKMEQAKLANNDSIVAENNLYLAVIYYKLKSTDVAIEYNLEALKGFKQIKDTVFIISSLNFLTRAYSFSDNNSIANKYATETLELSIMINDTSRIVRSYIRIATNELMTNLLKGYKSFKKAEEAAEKLNDIKGLIVIYHNIGYYYDEINMLDSAMIYYKKSLNLIEDTVKSSYLPGIYISLSHVAYKREKYKQSLSYVRKAMKLEKNNPYNFDYDEAYKLLIFSSIKTGNLDEAINYYEDYTKNRQEGIAKRKSEQAARFKILYEIDGFESKIKLLNTENKLKESKLLFITIVLSLTALILVFIIFQNIKLKKSYKKIVTGNIKSLEIEHKNEELKSIIEGKNTNISNVLADSEEDELLEKIKDLIEKEKLYTDSSLNINILSDKLETNRTYVSKAINEGYKKSFVEFINEYRVTETKKLLNSEDAKILTLEAIGNKAGFNSKSTFFRVFKSVVGVTPNFFLKNVQNV